MLDKIEPSCVVFGAVLVDKFNNWLCCFVRYKTGCLYVVYGTVHTVPAGRYVRYCTSLSYLNFKFHLFNLWHTLFYRNANLVSCGDTTRV